MLKLDKTSKTPIYLQIYQQLKDQIISGQLRPEERLKATRTLSEEYHLSRNTVLNAYQQLESEGFVRSIVGSGFYVEDLPEYQGNPEKEVSIPSVEKRSEDPAYDFRYGSIEPNVYRTRAFRKALKDAVEELERRDSLQDTDPRGTFGLREAISEHLREVRGVEASPDQIIITSGHHYSVSLLKRIIPNEIRTLAIEDPGHRDSRTIFMEAGFQIVPIPLDDNGIRTEHILSLRHSLVYVTPSHQFPMGMILPIGRRLQLLKWAKVSDSYIIEDDYDSELRYREQPVDALFSLDRNERVIYLGSFSKSLSPDLRVSYIVLPRSLNSILSSEDLPASSSSVLIQLALEKYLRSGEYRKRIARMRNILRKKHALIVDRLNGHYGDLLTVFGIGGGTHFVLRLPVKADQKQIVSFFRERDVGVYPTDDYFITKQGSDPLIMIGYSGIPSDTLNEYMDRFIQTLDELIKRSD